VADQAPGDGLGRALLLGLLAGAIVLALLVAAYAIGRDQGSDDAGTVVTRAPATAAAPTTAPSPPAVTGPALIAAGRELYTSSGCSGCHSLDGSPGLGPSLEGVAGRQVTLAGGQRVTADEAYLTEAIREPDARVVEGYPAGAMPDLGLDDEEIAALVAFLRSR
jgi:mono/diheme cytochrome c family protein